MATGDFGWLKLQLAFMAGRNTVSELDNNPNIASDSLLAGQCVNEAYLDCYLNPGGKRPQWALQTTGLQFGTPITGSVTVTQGSSTFAALSGVSVTMVGSQIQIGQGFYVLASTTSVTTPIQEPTGSAGFTLYQNSCAMPNSIVEMEFGPVVLGWGLLRPMNGREESIKWRQITYGDFWSPTPFGVGQMTSINWPGGISQPTGTPIFYYIDNTIFSVGSPVTPRMIVWPIPLQITTVEYQGWAVPTELSSDADLPVMPASLTTRVLLPLCREKWGLIYKKYTGGNVDALVREGDKARQILGSTYTAQRDKPVRMPLTNC